MSQYCLPRCSLCLGLGQTDSVNCNCSSLNTFMEVTWMETRVLGCTGAVLMSTASGAEHLKGVNLDGCSCSASDVQLGPFITEQSCFGAPYTFFQSIVVHSKDGGCGDGNGAVCVRTANTKILHFALFPHHWSVFLCRLAGCNEGQEEQHKPLLCALQRCSRAKVVWVLLGPLRWHGKVFFSLQEIC